MIKNFNLVQSGGKLENEMVVSLYPGETINLTLKNIDFIYVKANVKVNNIFIGNTTNGQIGIHSSKIKNGYNELTFDFLNANNEIISTLAYKFTSVPNIKTEKSLAKAYEDLIGELELLKHRVLELETWRQEIDNERSGF